MKIRKLYASALMIMAFTGFLAGQIFFKSLGVSASQSTPEANLKLHYESSLKKIKGTTFEGAELDLKKVNAPVVIINFWASWCVPCLEEFPSLVELRKSYGEEKVFILGINNDLESIKTSVQKTYDKYHLNFPSIPDEEKWTSLYKINAIPVTVIYIKGKVFTVSNGSYDFMNKALLRKINEVLES